MFGYDASGERVGYHDSVESGVRYTLRGLSGQVLREYFELGGSWSWVKDHVWAGGELMATIEPSGIKHLHRDHLGSVRLETSGTGAVVASHSYWPFGEAMTVTSSSERYRFAGHERDQRTGYDYMHARYYAPMAGRFFSVDPGRDYDFSHPQSFNLYAYVRNNPLLLVDPTGKATLLVRDSKGFRFVMDGNDDGVPDEVQDSAILAKANQRLEQGKVALLFDGEKLFLVYNGKVYQYHAVSGKDVIDGRSNPALQREKNRGPIPEGLYWTGEIQTFKSLSVMQKILASLGTLTGQWPGGTRAWGTIRTPLTADKLTETFGRSGFFLHGGAGPGSLGCVDLWNDAERFFAVFVTLPGHVLAPLVVDYPRWP